MASLFGKRIRSQESARWLGVWFLLLALTPVLFGAAAGPASSAGWVTKSDERGSYFFRLKATYSHKGEPIDFNIVVGCSVRVTRYRGGDYGFGASRYPRFFVHRTRDNHAVMQIVPIICRGQTTENGRVPKDFLPGAIWFETPGDYRFGIGYVSEDAFESPKSQLTFHGATVEKATRKDWEAFRKAAAENEGMRKRYYDRPFYWTEDAQRIASSGGKEVEAAYARGCVGVTRYKLSEAGRAVVRKYWPAGKPRYWAINYTQSGPPVFRELMRVERDTPVFANSFRYTQHLNGGNYSYGGFPTRARGGMLSSRSRKLVPPEIFPIWEDRGIPWVFTEGVARSPYLTKDVAVRTGPGKGFLYCYTTLNPGKGKLEVPLPNYRNRESRFTVDSEPVVTSEPRRWSWPSPFFEGDEYMYRRFGAGLS